MPFVIEIDGLVRLVWSVLVDIQQIAMVAIKVRGTLASSVARMPRQNVIAKFKLERIGS